MAQLKKILLIGDDNDLYGILSEQLIMTEQFAVAQCNAGGDAMGKVEQQLFDLVVLDADLLEIDGFELCRKLRKQGIKCPILMLTNYNDDSNTILELGAGANDYITKPFKFTIFLARIHAQLRQYDQSENATFTLGNYTFSPMIKMLLAADDRKIRLTEKETNILKFLYHANGGVVQRDTLLHEVWGYNAGVTTHTLETHIYRLRQKIEADPSNARLLVTDIGGYRLAV